jgi:hypothetical protein
MTPCITYHCLRCCTNGCTDEVRKGNTCKTTVFFGFIITVLICVGVSGKVTLVQIWKSIMCYPADSNLSEWTGYVCTYIYNIHHVHCVFFRECTTRNLSYADTPVQVVYKLKHGTRDCEYTSVNQYYRFNLCDTLYTTFELSIDSKTFTHYSVAACGTYRTRFFTSRYNHHDGVGYIFPTERVYVK